MEQDLYHTLEENIAEKGKSSKGFHENLTGRYRNMRQELIRLLMHTVRNSLRAVNRRPPTNADDGINRRVVLHLIGSFVKLFDRRMLTNLGESAGVMLRTKKLFHLLDQGCFVRKRGSSDYEGLGRF